MKFFKNKKGFTLVELVVVIAILGILAGIAIPRFMDATASARGAKIVADLRTIDSAATMYYAKEGKYPVDAAAAKTAFEGKYLATWPLPQTGAVIFPSGKTVGSDNAVGSYLFDGATGKTNRALWDTFNADALSSGGSAKS